MHEIKRDGLVNMIKKDLHNLNLMLKGHELSPHRHGKPHPAAASRQDERVLIVDDFLTPEEIKLATAQTYKLQAERSLTEKGLIAIRWRSHAEQQFIIDMPESVAERLRDAVDKHLGIDAIGVGLSSGPIQISSTLRTASSAGAIAWRLAACYVTPRLAI